jgi:hypothetical protein
MTVGVVIAAVPGLLSLPIPPSGAVIVLLSRRHRKGIPCKVAKTAHLTKM